MLREPHQHAYPARHDTYLTDFYVGYSASCQLWQELLLILSKFYGAFWRSGPVLSALVIFVDCQIFKLVDRLCFNCLFFLNFFNLACPSDILHSPEQTQDFGYPAYFGLGFLYVFFHSIIFKPFPAFPDAHARDLDSDYGGI
jgi:hypothetical protein